MKNTWIGRDISRSNFLYALCALACVASAIGLIYLGRNYVYNALAGPFPVDDANLGTLEELFAHDKYYVKLQARQLFKTGLVGTLNGANSTEFLLATDGRRTLLIRDHFDHNGNDITGTLETSAEFLTEARQSVANKNPEAHKMLLPFVLEGVVPFRWKAYALLLSLMGLAGAGFWLGSLALLRTINPLSHPYAIALKRYGSPERIAAELQAETANGVSIGESFFGTHWLWHKGNGGVHVFRLDDIVWVYRCVGVTGTQKIVWQSYRIIDRHGASMEVRAAGQAVDAFLTEIAKRLPWCANGINDDILRLWTQDQAAFIHAVDQRRAQLQATDNG
ncbi:MAG TPA: DUF6709 family protein [Gemmataceae bacterium]|nr:DUF6709 family protein [Gemmataceae bacterium]